MGPAIPAVGVADVGFIMDDCLDSDRDVAIEDEPPDVLGQVEGVVAKKEGNG